MSIYGSPEYEKRRAYEVDRIQSGRSVTPYTIGGASAARQAASERRASSPPSPSFHGGGSSYQSGPYAGTDPTWAGTTSTRRSSGSFGKMLTFGGGVFGAIYAASHGAPNAMGLIVGLMVGYLAVGVVVHFLKKIFG